MNIGFFDSGIGGLTVFNEIVKFLPRYDYLYLGDSARAPYGERGLEEIYEFTKQGVEWLFRNECILVILACNTASSQALRKLQREWLSHHFPERRILGVIIPIAQEAALRSKGVVGVIGTKATIESQAYIKELRKIRHNLKIIQIALPEIVQMIERGAGEDELRIVLKMYLSPLKEVCVDTLILGCTHYPLLRSLIRNIMGKDIYIPNVNEIAAQKLKSYLDHHPEIEKQLSKNSTHQFFTTGDPERFSALSERFFGRKITAQKVSL